MTLLEILAIKALQPKQYSRIRYTYPISSYDSSSSSEKNTFNQSAEKLCKPRVHAKHQGTEHKRR